MGIKNKWLSVNPYSKQILHQKREKLHNRNITILASNCLGGLLYHTYQLKFLSPLVNTRVNSKEFVKFITNFNHYIEQPLRFVSSDEPFPVALLDDITINFVHYHTQLESEKKWSERKKRMDLNNTFIILNDCDGITQDDLNLLDHISFKNIIVFTAQKYPNKCAFWLPPFSNQAHVGNTMLKSWISGEMVVEQYFDFASWFNQDKGTELENYRIK